jgi:ABC-type multidrug transport system ATPase subunit
VFADVFVIYIFEVLFEDQLKCCCRFAYVRQEDLFFSQLTVRETLSLAIELQLPHISSVEERDEYVNNLLFKIGLVSFSIHVFCFGR